MATLDVASVGRESFEPHLNSSFKVSHENSDESVEVTLLECSEYPDHRPNDQKKARKPFSIVLGCKTHPLEQGTYQFKHNALGEFSAFLSPFEVYEDGHKFEIVFA